MDPTQTPVVPPTPPPSDNKGRPKKILVVEDDAELATIYTTLLKAEDYDVYHVSNGEEALATVMSYKPDLVVLDVMMPKVSGFDVLDILRNTPETANTKVIMLTALSQDVDKQRAEALGVQDYIVKSQVIANDVISRIHFHLDN